jgi:predicted DNA-binding transcriptional regulator AlpA
MSNEIVGEKEIAAMLAVKENTVHQWKARGNLPEPDGIVSGSPAWFWSTISAWAGATGRTPVVRDSILAVLASSPSHGSFATPITRELTRMGVVGPDTSPARIASILTELLDEGLVSLHLRNEWRITSEGRAAVEGQGDDPDITRLRRLYETTRRLVVEEPTCYYTEQRYRAALLHYARALIAGGNLNSEQMERLVAAYQTVTEADQLPWSPRTVEARDVAHLLLQQVVDHTDQA